MLCVEHGDDRDRQTGQAVHRRFLESLGYHSYRFAASKFKRGPLEPWTNQRMAQFDNTVHIPAELLSELPEGVIEQPSVA